MRNWLKINVPLPSPVFRDLYIAYAMSRIGDRMWGFTIALVLQHIGGISLVSIEQLVDGFAQMFLSTYFGGWLDRHDRKTGILVALALNNICVGLSAAFLIVCLEYNTSGYNILFSVALVFSLFASSLSCVGSEAEKIAFTKDWVVELTKREDQSESTLSAKNAIMKTLDQFASVISPLVAGFVLVQAKERAACFMFVIYNLVSWIGEAYLLVRVYNAASELSERKADIVDLKEDEASSGNGLRRCCSSLRRWHRSLLVFWRQETLPCAIGLAALYLTVLGFDGIAISFGKSQGMSEDILGVFRSAGSAFGIAGAILYSVIERRFGVRKTGLIGFISQQIALTACVASIWLPGSPFDLAQFSQQLQPNVWWERLKSTFAVSSNNTDVISLQHFTSHHSDCSIYALMTGITLARLGLWMTDLSTTQIMQQLVPRHERNTVFGVLNAACQFFSVSKDLMVIILPDPRMFGLLILVSVAFVFIGFICYIYYIIMSQKDLVKRKGKPNEKREEVPLTTGEG